MTSSRFSVRKPARATVMVYLPGGRAATMNRPLGSAVPVRTTLVSTLVTVTVAPGSTAFKKL